MSILIPLYNLFIAGATLYSERLLGKAPLTPRTELRAGSVAVIVPARNEERNIGRCVDMLLTAAARYGDAVVIVVDDGSDDGTPTILQNLQATHPARAQLEVLRLDEALPDGWLGKPRACWVGASHPRADSADWLLFVDADTEATPEALGRLVAGAVEHSADLFSIFTDQELASVPERLMMPHIFYVLAVSFSWRAVNDPDNPLAIANGQCLLMRRPAYNAIGGHAAVRGEIAEDKALAEIVKDQGYRLYLTEGRDVMRTRMYTTFAEIFEGWSKNAYLGLGERTWLLPLAVFSGLAGGIVPFIGLGDSLRRRAWGESGWWLISVVALLRNRDRAMREFNIPRWYALTTPLGAILCSALALFAWFRVVSGLGVTWKGRRYTSHHESGSGTLPLS